MRHVGGGIALWIVGLHVFDAVHWILHAMIRSEQRWLRTLATPHLMHHRWLDRSLTTRWEYQRRNVWGHLVLEFGTQLLFSMILLLLLPAATVGVCVLLQSLAFGYLLSQRGLDVNHRPVQILDAYRPSFVALPAYHALHHVYPDAHFSAYSKLLDYVVRAGTYLDGKRITVVGGDAPFAQAFSAALRGAGVVDVACPRWLDADVLRVTDVLLVCDPAADRRVLVEAYVHATRGRQLPPEVWAVQADARDGLARHYYRDVRVAYRAMLVDAADLTDGARARRAAGRALLRIRRGFNFVSCGSVVAGLAAFLAFRLTAPAPPSEVAFVARRRELASAA